MNNNKRFYITSLAVLAVLSAYPLINGARMAYLSAVNGAIEPEQYAKYVVPYAAICISLLLYAALQPLFFKLKRFAFPAGITTAYGVFFVVGRFFETMQIRVTGMMLIDPATMAADVAASSTTADLWQSALCIASPNMWQGLPAYELSDRLVYVMGNSAYKLHYYMISLLLITMVCGLIYSITKMIRINDPSQIKPVNLRGASTAALTALCIFANTTAFFRQPAPIQTPLASVLTGSFFIILGISAGLYVGSYMIRKGNKTGTYIPVSVAVCATVLMYVGEAVMMRGNLYRFGIGWFFDPLPAVVLAPVDVLIVLLSGAVTWLLIRLTRKYENWPGKRTMTAVIALCVAVAAAGPVITIATPATPVTIDSNMHGCYIVDDNLYTNPLSSAGWFGKSPSVYVFDEYEFFMANTDSGIIRSYSVTYHNEPVGADEFSSKADIMADWLPNISHYKERYLLAIAFDDSGAAYTLYRMDNEILLVEFSGTWIWTINRLDKTDGTTLEDIRRVLNLRGGEEPPPASWPAVYENQITLKDVYTLARKGSALRLSDFDSFVYMLTGDGFTVRKYDVVGADTVFVTVTPDGELAAAVLLSRRTLDHSQTVDLRDGFDALAAYMNPLKGFSDITIEDTYTSDDWDLDMFFEDDYFRSECRYYLNSKRSGHVFVLFENGERMTIKQALQERRVTVEMLVAHGLGSVSMIPIDNPLGGEFTVLHHLHVFTLNGEAFYPSTSFMYVISADDFTVYYNIEELTQILQLYGYDTEAEELRRNIDPADITAIAGGSYVRDTVLADAGVESDVEGLSASSHVSSHAPPIWSPVWSIWFSVGG